MESLQIVNAFAVITAFSDQILILGVKHYLESFGHSVYIDWSDDKELERSKVTKDTAKEPRKNNLSNYFLGRIV